MCITTPRRLLMPMALISVNTARPIFRRSPVSGRSFSSSPAIRGGRFLTPPTASWAYTSAMTVISPEGWRALALNGAELIINPSATVAGLSQYLWELEQPASAAANGVYIGAINRVGTEAPWNIGEFYGSSYFVNPRGKIEAQASGDQDELLVHELDMDMIREVRNTWQFLPRPQTHDLREFVRGVISAATGSIRYAP